MQRRQPLPTDYQDQTFLNIVWQVLAVLRILGYPANRWLLIHRASPELWLAPCHKPIYLSTYQQKSDSTHRRDVGSDIILYCLTVPTCGNYYISSRAIVVGIYEFIISTSM